MRNILFILISFSSILISCAQNKDLSYFEGKWDFRVWMVENKSNKPDIIAIWILDKNEDSIEFYNGYVTISDKIFTNETIRFISIENKYVRTIDVADNSKVEMKTSGWDGNKLIWLGKRIFVNSTIELKEEILKTNENEFEAIFYERRNNEWILTQKEVLKRIE